MLTLSLLAAVAPLVSVVVVLCGVVGAVRLLNGLADVLRQQGDEQLRLLLQIQGQLQDLGALPGQVERIEDLVQRRTAPRDLS